MRQGLTAGEALRRAWTILRTEGARTLWFRLLGETVYRRLVVTELRLPAPPLAADLPEGLEARFLRDEDVDAYAALRGEGHAPERLRRGERCYGLWLGGELVSTRWLAAGTARVDYLGRTVPLDSGTLYIHDVYVAPQARGRDLGVVSMATLTPLLEREGVSRIVGAIDPENRPGMRYNRRLHVHGYRLAGRIGWVGLGRRRLHFGSL